jgi:peptidoglycan/LPS O-acetylase OafA/YrhL
MSKIPAFEGKGLPFPLDLQGFINHMLLMEGERVTWSIAVEFKFYFILPFLIFFLFKIKEHIRFAFVPILVGLFIASQIFYPQHDSLRNDPRMLPYLPIFLFGIVLSIFYLKVRSIDFTTSQKRLLECLGLMCAVALILISPIIYSALIEPIEFNHFHKDFILYSVLWSGVIFSAICVNGIIRRIFSWRVFRYYGALSFSIYLFHPIFISLSKLVEINSSIEFLLVLVASTVSSHISYKYLEEPISRYNLFKK